MRNRSKRKLSSLISLLIIGAMVLAAFMSCSGPSQTDKSGADLRLGRRSHGALQAGNKASDDFTSAYASLLTKAQNDLNTTVTAFQKYADNG